jgi:hypothetical protein
MESMRGKATMKSMPRALTTVVVLSIVCTFFQASHLPAQAQEVDVPQPQSPIGMSAAAEDSFAPAFDIIDRGGDYGDGYITDRSTAPGAQCRNYYTSSNKSLTLAIHGPQINKAPGFHYYYPGYKQAVGWRVFVYQYVSGSSASFLKQSGLQTGLAGYSIPALFGNLSVTGMPLGPTYVVAVRLYWFDFYGTTVTGYLDYSVEFYKPYVTNAGGTTSFAVQDACYAPVYPQVSVSDSTIVVGQTISYSLRYFPLGRTLNITLDGVVISTVRTDSEGRATGSIKIPSTFFGGHNLRFSLATWTASAIANVSARISIVPSSAQQGSQVKVILRGYAAYETIRIRWLAGS